MPIVDLQRRMREIGRIRTGVQVPSRGGGKRPEKLETFRLTSPSRDVIDAAAAKYSGDVREWTPPDGQREWEVITKIAELEIVIPPENTLTQWYELWKAGGCVRRCDGRTNVLTMGPCECPLDQAERRALAADGEACKPTTRLNVILPELPDLGVWRLESHGFYAAVELGGTASFLEAAMAAGIMVRARLRLEQREKKEPGKQTKKYAVPVIEIPQTRVQELLAATGQTGGLIAGNRPAQLTAGLGGVPALPPGPALPPASDFRAPATAEQRGEVDEADVITSPAVPAGRVANAPETLGDLIDSGVARDPDRDRQPPEESMTREALLDYLDQAEVSRAYALELAGRVIADFDGTRQLTGPERAQLRRAIEAERKEGALL